MRLTKSLLCASLVTVLTISAVGQGKAAIGFGCKQEGEAVERKDDRFTGEATVTLKPQEIATGSPGQRLKVALEYKIKPRLGPAQSVIPEMVKSSSPLRPRPASTSATRSWSS